MIKIIKKEMKLLKIHNKIKVKEKWKYVAKTGRSIGTK